MGTSPGRLVGDIHLVRVQYSPWVGFPVAEGPCFPAVLARSASSGVVLLGKAGPARSAVSAGNALWGAVSCSGGGCTQSGAGATGLKELRVPEQAPGALPQPPYPESVADALRHSDERYRRLVEMSSDAVVIVDTRGDVVWASPATRDLFALPEDLPAVGQHSPTGSSATTAVRRRRYCGAFGASARPPPSSCAACAPTVRCFTPRCTLHAWRTRMGVRTWSWRWCATWKLAFAQMRHAPPSSGGPPLPAWRAL